MLVEMVVEVVGEFFLLVVLDGIWCKVCKFLYLNLVLVVLLWVSLVEGMVLCYCLCKVLGEGVLLIIEVIVVVFDELEVLCIYEVLLKFFDVLIEG